MCRQNYMRVEDLLKHVRQPTDGNGRWMMEVPEGWDVERLSDIAEKVMVGIASAATHAYAKDGVTMLRNLNIKEGRIDVSDLLYIDRDYETQHRNKRLRLGDIITVRKLVTPSSIRSSPEAKFDGASSVSHR